MKVCEVFKSFNGEGPEIGHPTIFFRGSGCNLIKEGNGCRWCDSLYAEKGIETTIKQAKKMIEAYHLKHVTFTGGEILTQEKELEKLLKELDIDYHFSLETNGTIYTSLPFNTIVISPKKQAINMKVLGKYSKRDNTYFKFVYENNNDKFWESIIFSLKIPRDRVYIMPEGKTREEQLNKLEEVADYCVKNNFNLSLRAHVLIYGNRRGV